MGLQTNEYLLDIQQVTCLTISTMGLDTNEYRLDTQQVTCLTISVMGLDTKEYQLDTQQLASLNKEYILKKSHGLPLLSWLLKSTNKSHFRSV